MQLSTDQKDAFDYIMEWFHNGNKNTVSLGGYAGTGKTTLLAYLRQFLGEQLRVAFMTYTGKASSVLRQKLNKNNLLYRFPLDSCTTIHSTIYQPEIENNKVVGWILKNSIDYDLIVIDEGSMINKEIYEDVESFNIPMILIGDHGQLPPVGIDFNLMNNPDIKLERIHRQSLENPIIKLSILAREEGFIPYGVYGSSIAKVHKKDQIIHKFLKNSGNFNDTAILCGFNKTRVTLNKKIREFLKHSDISNFPNPGERVICLRNNKSAKHCPIYNGVQGTVKTCIPEKNYMMMEVYIDGEHNFYKGIVSQNCFNNDKPEFETEPLIIKKENNIQNQELKEFFKDFKFTESIYPDYFDFGYCLSVHKSQGSEYNRVMLIEEPCQYWSGENWNRWLYTAVTRAKEQLLIVR